MMRAGLALNTSTAILTVIHHSSKTMATRAILGQKQQALRLLSFIQAHGPACPCHGCSTARIGTAGGALKLAERAFSRRKDPVETDYAFQMAASNIRYGPGVTAEVGMDFQNMGVERVALFTDQQLLHLDPVKKAVESLEKAGIKYDIYSDVICEPKDYGVRDAMAWARKIQPQAYLSVGGGSVMDYAKIANLFQVYPDEDLLTFTNAPVGQGKPIKKELLPHIAIPTTQGTGSETTGTAIFDMPEIQAKTGIASRAMKPTLGIVDPLNGRSMPTSVKASSGLDVLCHALESWTAIPFNQRSPRPKNPIDRPAYQGSNPISDIFVLAALKMTVDYLPRSVQDPDDFEAQENMMLAATLAGVGFGNAGVHLCHGLSYGISSQNPGYKHYQYEVGHPIIPHGVSVAVTAPAVFKHTAPSNPERHLKAAEIFGADISNVKLESAGEVLKEQLQNFLHNRLGDQPKGLKDFGYTAGDLPALVKGALPQRRVLNLAPSVHDADEGLVSEYLGKILEESL